jgi:hypothetical protein
LRWRLILPTGNKSPALEDLDLLEAIGTLLASFPTLTFLAGVGATLIESSDPVLAKARASFFFYLI